MDNKDFSAWNNSDNAEGETDTMVIFDDIIGICRTVFIEKMREYGTSWMCLRNISSVDQIWIKARRIRAIQEKGQQKVSDSISEDYVGILNYSVMALIQVNRGNEKVFSEQQLLDYYNSVIAVVKDIAKLKNHDYGDAWKEMSDESFVDLILMKLSRIKSVYKLLPGAFSAAKHLEPTLAHFSDIINYSVFALIRRNAGK